ncbi:MAG TPA: thioredoxin domain-containing protein [Gemmatimonadales bacterium]|nr:thioredoxin domain-containing protein [Gemmatimonadales bacterium]
MRSLPAVPLIAGLALVLTGSTRAPGSTGVTRLVAPSPPPPAWLPAGTPQADLYLAERTKGSATAPLTVYEMSDFQCPFCRRQAVETFPTIEHEFIDTGKVRWIFLNLPLTNLHPNAAAAAEFAMCAARAQKFWPVHDLLFTYQDKWAPLKDPAPFLITLADSAGIPRPEMLDCLQKHEMLGLVQAEAEGAAKSGVHATPTAYIQGVGLIAGAQPVAVFREVLDSLWRDKTEKKPAP